MKSFRLSLITIVAGLLAGTVAAFASPAMTTANIDLRSGPGPQFPVTGLMFAQKAVDVSQCRDNWCEISGGGLSGWAPASSLQSAAQPQPQPQPQPLPQPQPQPQPQPLPQPQPVPRPQPSPHPWPGLPTFPWPQPQPQPLPSPLPRQPRPAPPPPVYDEAGACFYSETNFGGYSFCLDEGETANRLRNWEDRIRSVEIFGGARVDLCTDPNLYGSCITLRSDATRLPGQLDRRASSLDVY